MATGTTLWWRLPAEIQNEIVSFLPVVGGNCGQLATVCRTWQSIIEPLNFAKITLNAWRLIEPESQDILSRKKNQIRYICDNQHEFKYLSFYPDIYLDGRPSPDGPEQNITHPHDPCHGWFEGKQIPGPDEDAINICFDEIMSHGLFDDERYEMEWWRNRPLVPVVGVVLLRQQTRRRWKPVALANMLARFPNMKQLCYEPWREWSDFQTQTDEDYQTLIESFASTKLCKLMIFENFNETYPERFEVCPALREPNPAVSQEFARASQHLTMLSASFIADAVHFFAALQDSWTWDKLTSLTLTSRVLADSADTLGINKMLQDAAAAALKMPRLDTMELWTGGRNVAMLFRYQRTQEGKSAITVRGTSELTLGVTVMQA
ncbi:hypothetical protein FPOA_11530 [Fusarium poae]|uniref:F-box domain-containing protein n=1 Tax=Fusarium poae TaxID=36050 RepID=A0A1B8AH31_FUSPO|nr:hypothetical protein FPOA_11530 [Fusarium poae]